MREAASHFGTKKVLWRPVHGQELAIPIGSHTVNPQLWAAAHHLHWVVVKPPVLWRQLLEPSWR